MAFILSVLPASYIVTLGGNFMYPCDASFPYANINLSLGFAFAISYTSFTGDIWGIINSTFSGFVIKGRYNFSHMSLLWLAVIPS